MITEVDALAILSELTVEQLESVQSWLTRRIANLKDQRAFADLLGRMKEDAELK